MLIGFKSCSVVKVSDNSYCIHYKTRECWLYLLLLNLWIHFWNDSSTIGFFLDLFSISFHLWRLRLMGALRAFVNELFYKSLNTTFMGIIKTIKKSIAFFFSYKNFLKIASKSISLEHSLTFYFTCYYYFLII